MGLLWGKAEPLWQRRRLYSLFLDGGSWTAEHPGSSWPGHLSESVPKSFHPLCPSLLPTLDHPIPSLAPVPHPHPSQSSLNSISLSAHQGTAEAAAAGLLDSFTLLGQVLHRLLISDTHIHFTPLRIKGTGSGISELLARSLGMHPGSPFPEPSQEQTKRLFQSDAHPPPAVYEISALVVRTLCS